jgi:RNA polymerase sigma factor (sigma-70 family)
MSPGLTTRLLATQSDERLIALARDGHERAFEALVLRYRKALLRYCRRLPLAEGRVEDVLQQALLQAWMALGRGAEVREPRAWLYRIVRNTAFNAMREGGGSADLILDDETPGLEPASEPDLGGGLAMRETFAEMAALPALQREVIVRTAVGGYSHEEVASALGLSDGAVRGLLYRARATLRTAMTALTPPPLLLWLIGGGAGPSAQSPEWLSGLAAGGGTAGLGGILLKGGAVAVTAGTLIGTSAGVLHSHGATHRHAGASARATARPAIAPPPAAVAVARVRQRPAVAKVEHAATGAVTGRHSRAVHAFAHGTAPISRRIAVRHPHGNAISSPAPTAGSGDQPTTLAPAASAAPPASTASSSAPPAPAKNDPPPTPPAAPPSSEGSSGTTSGGTGTGSGEAGAGAAGHGCLSVGVGPLGVRICLKAG